MQHCCTMLGFSPTLFIIWVNSKSTCAYTRAWVFNDKITLIIENISSISNHLVWTETQVFRACSTVCNFRCHFEMSSLKAEPGPMILSSIISWCHKHSNIESVSAKMDTGSDSWQKRHLSTMIYETTKFKNQYRNSVSHQSFEIHFIAGGHLIDVSPWSWEKWLKQKKPDIILW